MPTTFSARSLGWTACLLLAGSLSQAAIPVTFNFLDSPGEGFFSNAPISDPDVPNASTVGEARRTVVQAAADHLGSFFQPSYAGEAWTIDATFDPLDGGIAAAWPQDGSNGAAFSGGDSGVWYPATLANHLSGSTVFSGSHVGSEFDTNTDWDYGTDGPPSGFKESLFSTAAHEILHGLGFLSDLDDSGDYFEGIPTIFDTFLKVGESSVPGLSRSQRAGALVSDNLFFTGPQGVAANSLGAGPVPIHAPPQFEEGSTGSHLDRDSFALIGDLMLPEASSQVPEPIYMSRLSVAMMADLGYALASTNLPGDYNGDGAVNAADYTVWRDRVGQPMGTLPNDFAGGVIGTRQYDAWKPAYGDSLPANGSAVPEPVGYVLLVAGLGMVSAHRN